MTWSTVSGVVGILGFLLSLALAIQKLRERCLRLTLSKISVGYFSNESHTCFIFVTLTNTTSVPVSLLSFDIATPDLTAKNSDKVFSYDYSDNHFSFDNIVITTPLPCHLSPYETKEICIAVENQQIKETLLRPEMLRDPEELRKRCRIFQRSSKRADQTLSKSARKSTAYPIELVIYTPIGRKRFPVVFDEIADRKKIVLFAFRKGLLQEHGDFL